MPPDPSHGCGPLRRLEGLLYDIRRRLGRLGARAILLLGNALGFHLAGLRCIGAVARLLSRFTAKNHLAATVLQWLFLRLLPHPFHYPTNCSGLDVDLGCARLVPVQVEPIFFLARIIGPLQRGRLCWALGDEDTPPWRQIFVRYRPHEISRWHRDSAPIAEHGNRIGIATGSALAIRLETDTARISAHLSPASVVDFVLERGGDIERIAPWVEAAQTGSTAAASILAEEISLELHGLTASKAMRIRQAPKTWSHAPRSSPIPPNPPEEGNERGSEAIPQDDACPEEGEERK